MRLHKTLLPRKNAVLGFTMIELISVMILIGILATVAISRIDVGAFRERGFYDALKANLQLARKAAVAKRRQVNVTVVLNGAAGSDALTFSINLAAPENTPTGATPLNLASRDSNCTSAAANTMCVPAGVSLTAGNTFYFDALGRPSAAVTFKATGQADITVEQETGYVH